MRVPFEVSREELLAGDRGAADVDFADLDDAAQPFVEAENTAVFHAWPKRRHRRHRPACPHKPIARPTEASTTTRARRARGRAARAHGIDGPYGLALGREDYTSVVETAENGGYPLLDHLRNIIKGPIVWAPGLKGAVVVSLRGGDFAFESGQDVSVGYESHDAEQVSLYLEESYSFRVLTPEAAVAIA